jgi:acyl-CoA thioesterase FadM
MNPGGVAVVDAMRLRQEPRREGPIIVNAHCTFVRQLEYPGTVLVRHYVGRIGNSSFETYDEMLRTDDPGRVYAHGGAKVVWVDYAQQKSRPLQPKALMRLTQTPKPTSLRPRSLRKPSSSAPGGAKTPMGGRGARSSAERAPAIPGFR